mgnify:CR=1 FL=1
MPCDRTEDEEAEAGLGGERKTRRDLLFFLLALVAGEGLELFLLLSFLLPLARGHGFGVMERLEACRGGSDGRGRQGPGQWGGWQWREGRGREGARGRGKKKVAEGSEEKGREQGKGEGSRRGWNGEVGGRHRAGRAGSAMRRRRRRGHGGPGAAVRGRWRAWAGWTLRDSRDDETGRGHREGRGREQQARLHTSSGLHRPYRPVPDALAVTYRACDTPCDADRSPSTGQVFLRRLHRRTQHYHTARRTTRSRTSR